LKLVSSERRKQKRDGPPLEEAPEPTSESVPDTALWIRQAIEKLEPNEREILMLREYEQLSYVEIAELLRLPLNTVRTRLFRSRMALKGHLHPQAEKAVASGEPSGTNQPRGKTTTELRPTQDEGVR